MTELADIKKQIAEMKFASDPEKAMCKLSNYLHILQRVEALERTAQHWSRMVNAELNDGFAFMEHDKIPDSPPERKFKDSLESRQPAPEPICAAVDISGQENMMRCVKCNATWDKTLWDEPCERQPAPEPEQREWYVDYTRSLEQASYAVYGDQTFALEELVSMLIAHGITPDSQPAPEPDQRQVGNDTQGSGVPGRLSPSQVERGQRLLRLYKENSTQAVTDFMRDWISQVCGEK